MCNEYVNALPTCDTCRFRNSCTNPINPYRITDCYHGPKPQYFTRDYWYKDDTKIGEIYYDNKDDPRGTC